MKNYSLFSLFLLSILFTHCEAPIGEGQRLYEFHCAGCHGINGEGFQKVYPPLQNSDFLNSNFLDLPCIIIHGIQEEIIVNGIIYDIPMTGIETLNNVEVANIVNHINKKMMDSKYEYFSPFDIEDSLFDCK